MDSVSAAYGVRGEDVSLAVLTRDLHSLPWSRPPAGTTQVSVPGARSFLGPEQTSQADCLEEVGFTAGHLPEKAARLFAEGPHGSVLWSELLPQAPLKGGRARDVCGLLTLSQLTRGRGGELLKLLQNAAGTPRSRFRAKSISAVTSRQESGDSAPGTLVATGNWA